MVTVSLQDLQRLMSGAVDAGIQAYVRTSEPDTDNIKLSEAKRYIKARGYKAIMLRKWTEHDLLHPHKTGDNNCAVIFSLAEIKQLLVSLELKELCNNQ